MGPYVMVALGGAVGSVLRLGVVRLAQTLVGSGFPAGTMAVNLIGSTIMGFVGALLAERGGSDPLRLFLMTGVLGGFTTFSAYSLDALALWDRGEGAAAALYVVASVVLGLAGVAIGFYIGRQVLAS